MDTFKFHNLTQNESSLKTFVRELRKQASKCEFKCTVFESSYSERMIKDKLVLGVQDRTLLQALLNDPGLSLVKAIKFSKVLKASKADVKKLSSEAFDVNAVGATSELRGKPRLCKFCRFQHVFGRNRCPAFGQICKV